MAHSNTPPHVYVTMWKYLHNAAQMFTHAKKEGVVSVNVDAGSLIIITILLRQIHKIMIFKKSIWPLLLLQMTPNYYYRWVLYIIWLCCSWNKLQVRLARGEPPTEPGFSQGFFSILSTMEFWFLAAVASALLSLGHLSIILDFFLFLFQF